MAALDSFEDYRPITLPGWELVSTGGGCEALELQTPDGGRWLITTADDPIAPSSHCESVFLGRYDRDDDKTAEYLCVTVTAAVEVVGGMMPDGVTTAPELDRSLCRKFADVYAELAVERIRRHEDTEDLKLLVRQAARNARAAQGGNTYTRQR